MRLWPGLILWAGRNEIVETSSADEQIRVILATIGKDIQAVSLLFKELTDQMLADEFWKKVSIEGELPLIWSVSRNRAALPAIARSVPAVKADAATTLFKINCSEIAWAVLDFWDRWQSSSLQESGWNGQTRSPNLRLQELPQDRQPE